MVAFWASCRVGQAEKTVPDLGKKWEGVAWKECLPNSDSEVSYQEHESLYLWSICPLRKLKSSYRKETWASETINKCRKSSYMVQVWDFADTKPSRKFKEEPIRTGMILTIVAAAGTYYTCVLCQLLSYMFYTRYFA